MSGAINKSQFSMWRAIFAIAHADETVSDDEQDFVSKTLEIVPFSEEQIGILKEDMEAGRDVTELFLEIEDQDDRATFFHYARMLAWCDGDFATQEQELLSKLQRLQVESVDFAKMMETAVFSFEGELQRNRALKEYQELTEKGRKGVIKNLADKFRRI